MREEIVEKIALERIEILFDLAKARIFEGSYFSLKLAKRYVNLAKEISMHYKVKMPKRVKNSICKNCNGVLIPGLTCTVRLASNNSFVVYKCVCGKEKHLHY